MKVVRRTAPTREPVTEVTRVVEEGVAPPPGPPLEPAPDRELWPWLLLLLVLVIGGIVAAVLLSRDDDKKSSSPRTTVLATPPATVTVARVTTPKTPAGSAVARVKLANVLGISASTAVKRLRDDGFQAVVRSVFSTKPQGVVAAQKPVPGTTLARGAAVTLSVSKGEPAKPVPDVVGQSESQAVALLKAAGFGATPFLVPSGETKGNVIAQKPRADEKARPGANVRLNVSSGATPSGGATTAPAPSGGATTAPAQPPTQPATVSVPDVEGQTLQEARLALRQAGIVMAIRYVPNEQPTGTVVAQAKRPGTTVKRGDHMLLTVSEGGSGGTAAATLVAVPDVVGLDEQAAQARLEQAGFAAIVEDYATGDTSQDGNVVDEQPAPGTKAPKGSQIIIYVGRLQSTG
ncbi:MAG TPA: PASTA domain-containing protein [Gaiellaceae bacterium]|nr:PASTA domain-containing protein [Gaiellaceae bacterium]